MHGTSIASPEGELSGPQITPLSQACGAEIVGLNLNGIDAAWPLIKAAFLKHHLVVLRDFRPSESEFGAIADRFGLIEDRYILKREGKTRPPIHFIQNVDANGNVVQSTQLNANYFWHTDKQYYPRPSLITMLQAIELPVSGGGDTVFADMTAAYEALSEQQKARLEGLKAVYSLEHMLRTCLHREPTTEELSLNPVAVHPLVRTHAQTGRRSLFLGMYCSEIVGMPKEDGRRLIDELMEHATSEQFVYTHRWRDGDLMLWDNRCLLHRAVPNYAMTQERRILRRVVVTGEVPI